MVYDNFCNSAPEAMSRVGELIGRPLEVIESVMPAPAGIRRNGVVPERDALR